MSIIGARIDIFFPYLNRKKLRWFGAVFETTTSLEYWASGVFIFFGDLICETFSHV
tara:strand:- start:203 stop:370 length:168 start_codon:yes stop_codon:yes gene_type:complete